MSATEYSKQAKLASVALACCPASAKSRALFAIHEALQRAKDGILSANRRDLEDARTKVAAGTMSKQLLKRLDLDLPGKWDSMLSGVLDIEKLTDPVGTVTLARELDQDLNLYRVSCPVGVLLIIFEARPEVVVQISALAIKSGNAVLLKGGKEAHHSNQALFAAIQEGLASAASLTNLSPSIVQLIESREDINILLGLDKYIDLVIPRGSNQLVRFVQEHTRIPVLGHADGICSVYVDAEADVATATRVIVDGKTNYPAACNATEKLLVHADALSTCLPGIAKGLLDAGVSLRACPTTFPLLAARFPQQASAGAIVPAADGDFEFEFLDLVIAIRHVSGLEEAILHINETGSHHTDCIVTTNAATAQRFMDQIDSAGVYWNASTRFADGFRYGFGAEIGVSTNKTHARGPVGLEGLLIYKYRMYGKGHIVQDYSSGTKSYTHRNLDLALPQ
ncbi:hypothetical protein HDU91_003465 [Kappamyces sp. JEL0680]|nr:hypothetical protein HDU91_003465 [Kappamyces sp. JEL0680]